MPSSPDSNSENRPYLELRWIYPDPSPNPSTPEPSSSSDLDQSSMLLLFLSMLIVAIVVGIIGEFTPVTPPPLKTSLPVPEPPPVESLPQFDGGGFSQGGPADPVPPNATEFTTNNQTSVKSDGMGSSEPELPEDNPIRLGANSYIASTQIRVGTCRGLLYEGANFRDIPSLDDASIIGVVPLGEFVELTGRSRLVGNVDLYEVYNLTRLTPSSRNPRSVNALGSNQIGWVAGCFLF